jgi:hypothetical protein
MVTDYAGKNGGCYRYQVVPAAGAGSYLVKRGSG